MNDKISSPEAVQFLRRTCEILSFSVLNTEISPVHIGAHDFNESVYRLYKQLKWDSEEFSLSSDPSIPHDEWYRTYRYLENFLRVDLLPFLMKYHKKLWKRFDVPRKVFFRVGPNWGQDVKDLRERTRYYINIFVNLLEGAESKNAS